MSADDHSPGLRTSHRALLRYAVVWIAVGTCAVGLGVIAVRGLHAEARHHGRDPIGAVVASGCVLEQTRGRQARLALPPVSGPPGRATADGVYATAQPRRRLVAALREGVVVVQYQPHLASGSIAAVRKAFASTHPRRIVAPDGTGMTFAVAATAWRRVLGCSKVDPRVVSALRAFAARYGGSGPGG